MKRTDEEQARKREITPTVNNIRKPLTLTKLGRRNDSSALNSRNYEKQGRDLLVQFGTGKALFSPISFDQRVIKALVRL